MYAIDIKLCWIACCLCPLRRRLRLREQGSLRIPRTARQAKSSGDSLRPVHFISGLPRSGSTLLAGLLRQNPRFHAGMSSPVGGLFNTLQGEMSGRNEYSVFTTDAQRRRILQGIFDDYYGPEFVADVVFDTNRLWCSKLRILRELCPVAKVIACVRHLPWIIDSIEQLIRRNAFQPSSIFSYQPGGTVYSRSEGLSNGDGMVGFAYNALKEAVLRRRHCQPDAAAVRDAGERSGWRTQGDLCVCRRARFYT